MSIVLSEEIRKRYGFVRRGRGCYLYTEKGVRLTDCFLEGGRALLGWDAGKARTAFKDTLERGATGSFDAGMLSRAETAVRHLLPPEYSCIRFYGLERARLIDLKNAFSPDESAADMQLSKAVVARPFLDIQAVAQPKVTGYDAVTVSFPEDSVFALSPAVVRVIPPFPWAGAPDVYAFRDGAVKDGAHIPENDVMPSALLAAFARAFHDLKSELAARTEEQFAAFTRQISGAFSRKKCYLYPVIERESYNQFMLECLDAGIILSPDYDIPSIIPYGAHQGDLKKIAGAYRKVTGEAL